jgi:hypothetical protein
MAFPVFNYVAPQGCRIAAVRRVRRTLFPGCEGCRTRRYLFLDAEIPSANGVVTARALGKMYGAIANGGQVDRTRFLSPQLVAGLTGRKSFRPDRTFWCLWVSTWVTTRVRSAPCRVSATSGWAVHWAGRIRRAVWRLLSCITACYRRSSSSIRPASSRPAPCCGGRCCCPRTWIPAGERVWVAAPGDGSRCGLSPANLAAECAGRSRVSERPSTPGPPLVFWAPL